MENPSVLNKSKIVTIIASDEGDYKKKLYELLHDHYPKNEGLLIRDHISHSEDKMILGVITLIELRSINVTKK